MMHCFLTGTDTGVGKTTFARWLVAAWRASGREAVGLKPITAGGRDDARLLAEACDHLLSLDEINPPELAYAEPAAPLIAAEQEGRTFDLDRACRVYRDHQAQFSHLLVEGVGGWLVPLGPSPDVTVREWAVELNLPVVIVARAVLGTLNHTLLTVESIHAAGLDCCGIVLNAGLPCDGDSEAGQAKVARATNSRLLHLITKLPVFEFTGVSHPASEIPIWLK